MQLLFEVCFYFGLGYSAIVFFGNLLGFFSLGIDSDIDIDLNPNGDLDLDINISGDVPGYSVSPMKPVIIVPAITVFGGVGWIGINNNSNLFWIWISAIISGFIAGYIIQKFIISPIYKAEVRSLVVTKKAAIGKNAIVRVAIKPNRLGSIRYYLKDVLYNSSAKSIDNQYIKSGENVTIKQIEDGVMIVEKAEN